MIGVAPYGKIDGQQISDNTMREVAAVLERFEPLARFESERGTSARGERQSYRAIPHEGARPDQLRREAISSRALDDRGLTGASV